MKIKLLRDYGGHTAGDTIERDDTEARWLVGIGRATSDKVPAYQQTAAAPGEHGPDPLAGGDPTRLYGVTTVKSDRQDNGALPVPGSPIQYNKGVAPDQPPVRPQDQSGRTEAKRQAQTNRERPAGAPRLETNHAQESKGKTTSARKTTGKS